jgi:hypothetical protein
VPHNCIFATVGAAVRLLVDENVTGLLGRQYVFFLSVIKATIQVPTDIPSPPKIKKDDSLQRRLKKAVQLEDIRQYITRREVLLVRPEGLKPAHDKGARGLRTHPREDANFETWMRTDCLWKYVSVSTFISYAPTTSHSRAHTLSSATGSRIH